MLQLMLFVCLYNAAFGANSSTYTNISLLTDIMHKGTKFKPLLSVFTPKLEHYRKEYIDHLLQFVDELLKFIERDVLVVNESETFKSVISSQKVDQFLLITLRRYRLVNWLLERGLTPKPLTDYEEFISKYNLEFFSPEQINNLKTLFNK